MATRSTIEILLRLEREMEEAGRAGERDALRDAIRSLGRKRGEMLTTGQAADRLGISIPTVKRWVERGTLAGYSLGSRWFVSSESVDRLIELRDIFRELDEEGNPTDEEIQALYARRGARAALNAAST